MSIGLHPRIIGQPAHIDGLARFLDYLLDFPDVWLTTRTELARYWLEHVPFELPPGAGESAASG
jgi:hypothetical protein